MIFDVPSNSRQFLIIWFYICNQTQSAFNGEFAQLEFAHGWKHSEVAPEPCTQFWGCVWPKAALCSPLPRSKSAPAEA